MKNKIEKNIHLFPRSEYYTRFEGTTAFAMNDGKHYGTYHRSESSRFFSEAGGRGNFKFNSPCVDESKKGKTSFHAHVGGISSPLNNVDYKRVISLAEQVPEGNIPLRDKLLSYKCKMVEAVVTRFNDLNDNLQKINIDKRRRTIISRPIVFYENDYPCVLVQLPVLNSAENSTESTQYWEKHPKPFQKLLLASFIAILNDSAYRKRIPIEMVIRASFGHNLPSICETDKTFRINVGLIPESYAELIGEALHKLNQSISQITDKTARKTPFNEEFHEQVHKYNVNKLKKALDKPLYEELRGTSDYRRMGKSKNAFSRLYKSFEEKNKTAKKGRSSFKPVCFEGKNRWEAIRLRGDSMGKSLLSECFRENKVTDWFADKVMEYLSDECEASDAIQKAIYKMLCCITYEADRVTMAYEKIDADLARKKWKFKTLSFKPLYKKHSDFAEIVELYCEGLLVDKPNSAIYSALEYAGANFLATYRGSRKIRKKLEYGSDSEYSDDLSSDEEDKKKIHISHSKLRVCSGMKAIVLAHYGALVYLHENNEKHFKKDNEQMYYEVEEALGLVKAELKPNKVRSAKNNNSILYYDLNHCNASNAMGNITLRGKLADANPCIVILDYTSSTMLQIKNALKQCFSRNETELVIMVDSGLKNNQAGLDYNPYGEVRVLASNSNRDICKDVIRFMKDGLSEKDKLSYQAHELVRAFKRRGFAPSFYGSFFKGKDRFLPLENIETEALESQKGFSS